jgi:hypothetical protein
MAIEHDITRGGKAREVLESEVYIDSFDIIKTELLNTWQQSPSRDIEGREKLYLMLAMLNKVQSTLQSVMETGMLAQSELNHKRTMLDRAREFGGF